MSETVTLSGYDPSSWIWIPIVCIVLGAAIVVILDVAFELQVDLAGPLITVGVLLGGMFGIMVPAIVGTQDHDQAQRVAAIHNLGYSDIAVDGDKFTASDDGIYKSGAFVQVDGDQWIILEGK